jgi:two-component system response regulator YesN
MYRVFIVDDEPLIRLALQQIVPWAEEDCTVIGEAANGQEVWERVCSKQDIDLLILDIHMPKMNGITLLTCLKEADLKRKPVCIVLSAFSDYEYVRHAFLLGAVDYIVKSDLSPEHVIPVLRKTIELLKDREQEDQTDDASASLKANMLLKEFLVHKQPILQSIDLAEVLSSRLQGTGANQQLILDVLVDRTHDMFQSEKDDSRQKYEYLYTAINQVLERENTPYELVSISPYEYVVLFFFEYAASYLYLRNRVAEITSYLRSNIKNYLDCSISIGVSDTCTDWKEWQLRYAQARQLVEMRFYEGPGRVFYYELNKPQSATEPDMPNPWDMTPLLQFIEHGDERWEPAFYQGIKILESEKRTLGSTLRFYQHLLRELGVLLVVKGLDWGHLLNGDKLPYELVEQFDFKKDLHDWLIETVNKAVVLLHSKKPEHSLGLVDKAKRYIENHFRKPIALRQVSEIVGVSESHLSKQFVKETGMNFVEFVTKLRILEAKRLLEAGMKMYQVSTQVGYENPEHFSRVFKKSVGLSPQQYREKHHKKYQ